MNVVLSVGGSVLAPDLEPERVDGYADVLEALADRGHDLGVVVGGGPTAREYISTARELGGNEIELDHIGIAVTRLNARLLITAMGHLAAPAPVRTYQEGRETMGRGAIPILGGTAPAQTTDAVSAAFAEFVDADLLVYATSVPGVYSADPNVDDAAQKFETISADDLVTLVSKLEMNAGSNAPVDLLAAKIIGRAGLRAIVLDGTDPASVMNAIETGDHDGTDVVPSDDDGDAIDRTGV